MNARDRAANSAAVFHPAVKAADNNGADALPCIEIGGVQIYAYVRDGILIVSLDFEGADSGPFATYGQDQVPTVIYANGDKPIWMAMPDNAVSEAEARLLRSTGDGRPGDWILPDWALLDWVNYDR